LRYLVEAKKLAGAHGKAAPERKKILQQTGTSAKEEGSGCGAARFPE
jgi:hypothetical protein